MGHPGTLPVLNFEAIKKVLMIGIAVNGEVADFTEWDRKNYFYPDIPKGYQISQYKYPLVTGGTLYGIDLERIHLEEDTAKSTHDAHKNTLVDFNRSGVPLMELVTTPTIHDATTAVNFAKSLQQMIRYLGAGEANLEKGEMRIEANISVMKISTKKISDNESDGKNNDFPSLPVPLGTKTEVKNLNSFKAVEKAVQYEVERQILVLESGEKVVQETRGWDDCLGETYSQRNKESSHDYRYFPDPDIPKLRISEIPEFETSKLKKEIPELPDEKRKRFISKFGHTEKEGAVFVEWPQLAEYFESIAAAYIGDRKKIKLTTNYLLTDYLGILKKGDSLEELNDPAKRIEPSKFSELICLISDSRISSRGAKDLIPLMRKDRTENVENLAISHNLIQKSDSSELIPIIEKIISDNEKVVTEYRTGKTASLQYLIGQVMKETKGSANPDSVRKLLLEKL